MIVQHNITAMNANRMLGLTTSAQAKSTKKLSSGYKINRAADDAAGLAISEKMRRQIRGLTQASQNAQDGISAVQTAEGALTEVHDMLQRLNELATKSANGTNSQEERDYIQSEVDALIDEIDRVSETTKFNEIYLLKGDPNGSTASTEGVAQKKTVSMKKETIEAMEGSLKVIAGQSAYAKGETNAVSGDTPAGTKGTMTINTGALGTDNFWGSTDGGTTYNQISADADFDTYFTVADDGTVTAKANTAFKTAAGTVNQAGINGGAGNTVADGTTLVTGGTEDVAAVPGDLSKYVEVVDGELKYKKGAMLYTDAAGTTQLKADDDLSPYFDEYGVYTGALEFNLHVGAEGGDASDPASKAARNKITVRIEAMSAAGIGIEGLKGNKAGADGKSSTNGVSTEESATEAIETIKAAIKKVSQQRSDLGAVQNRLEHTINNLDNIVENTTSAEAAIRDTDIATEMVRYSNNNILQQAGTSMLSQANQSNQLSLSLLG